MGVGVWPPAPRRDRDRGVGEGEATGKSKTPTAVFHDVRMYVRQGEIERPAGVYVRAT